MQSKYGVYLPKVNVSPPLFLLDCKSVALLVCNTNENKQQSLHHSPFRGFRCPVLHQVIPQASIFLYLCVAI